MGNIIGSPINVLKGTIVDSEFNNMDARPVELFTIQEPFIPVFFGLYFYDVTTDFIFDVCTINLALLTGSNLMYLNIAASSAAENKSFINLATELSYKSTTNFPFAATPVQISLSATMLTTGAGNIRYTFGYTYL